MTVLTSTLDGFLLTHRDLDIRFVASCALSSCTVQHALANKELGARAYKISYCAVNRILYAMHILVVAPVRACLWLHDCMVCIILQALNVLRQLRRGFYTIVLHCLGIRVVRVNFYVRAHVARENESAIPYLYTCTFSNYFVWVCIFVHMYKCGACLCYECIHVLSS